MANTLPSGVFTSTSSFPHFRQPVEIQVVVTGLRPSTLDRAGVLVGKIQALAG
jgi:hypothetical protein